MQRNIIQISLKWKVKILNMRICHLLPLQSKLQCVLTTHIIQHTTWYYHWSCFVAGISINIILLFVSLNSIKTWVYSSISVVISVYSMYVYMFVLVTKLPWSHTFRYSPEREWVLREGECLLLILRQTIRFPSGTRFLFKGLVFIINIW